MVLGIDTSNYTTSLALVDHRKIISDKRKLLTVKEGERGLRQQEALFQHVSDLPVLFSELMEDTGDAKIEAVACSVRPRPVDGSYMPVFMAGKSFAEVIASALKIPVYEFSHQEGHVEAASRGTVLEGESSYVFFHLSGGTTEAVTLPEYELCGGTLDIAFGQLIDRVGVALGMKFPCGREMDQLALAAAENEGHAVTPVERFDIPRIKVNDGMVNLSGIESACQRSIEREHALDKEAFCRELFDRIADALWKMTLSIKEKTGKDKFLFAGGVSSSLYIRERLERMSKDSRSGVLTAFGEPELCRDNAVGIALLGEKSYGA